MWLGSLEMIENLWYNIKTIAYKTITFMIRNKVMRNG